MFVVVLHSLLCPHTHTHTHTHATLNVIRDTNSYFNKKEEEHDITHKCIEIVRMIVSFNQLLAQTTSKAMLGGASLRAYTCVLARLKRPPMPKEGVDPRKRELKDEHYMMRLVEARHTQPWAKVDLLLTEYVEGVGYKGEIVNVPRHRAFTDMLPSRVAVLPTDEYLAMYKEEREALVNKPKISPYAMKTKEKLESLIIEIPMNADQDWTVREDHIRIALRINVNTYNHFICFSEMYPIHSTSFLALSLFCLLQQKIVCPTENISIPADLDLSSKNKAIVDSTFIVQIKVSPTLLTRLILIFSCST